MMNAFVDLSVRAVRCAGVFLALALPYGAHASSTGAQSDWCKRLAPRLPEISQAACESAGLVPSGAYSLQKFPILARHIPAQKKNGAKPPVRVLLLGGIHGDELTAPSIVFK